jgi:hypothetical protein
MDISDALDAYLQSKVKIGEWEQEFNARFYKPIGDMIIGMAMHNARNNPMIDQNKLESRLSPEALKRLRGEK